MTDDTTLDEAGPGDDGLGASIDPGAGRVPDFDEPADDDFDFGMLNEEEAPGDDGPPRDAQGRFTTRDEDAADPWGSPEAARFAQQKGWTTPADVTKAYRELESKLGQRQDPQPAVPPELTQVIQNQQAILQQLAQERAQQQQNQMDAQLVDFEEAAQSPEFDPGRAMNYIAYEFVPQMMHAVRQQAVQEARDQILQELRPALGQVEQVASVVGRTQLTSEAQTIRDRIGPDLFLAVGDRAGDLYAQDPTGGLEAAFARAIGEHHVREAAQARRDAAAGGALQGGRGPQPAQTQRQDPAQAVRDAIRGVGRRVDDGLS